MCRLRSLGLNVVDEARPIAASANLDKINFVNHGGVAILSRLNYRVSKLTNHGVYLSFEFACCRVSCGASQLILLTVHRPGSRTPKVTFFNEF
jgi:hypothetical protein